MGYLFMRQKDQDQAAIYFIAAAELDSQNCLAQYFAAQSEMSKGNDSDAAEKYLRKAIAINPQFAPAFGLLSQVLLQKTSNFAEALEFANKGAALQPGEMRYKLDAARVLAAMEKYDDAFIVANRALNSARNENDRSDAVSFMDWINRARNPKDMQTKIYTQDNPEREQSLTEKRLRDAKAEEAQLNAFNEAEHRRKAEEARMASIKTGPPAKLSGIIKAVKCDYPAVMDLVLDGKSRQTKMHAQNYYQVQYGAIVGAPKNDFDPCRDLEGKQAEIEYLTVTGEDFSGFIKSITIMAVSGE
jgi:tetratricopeptide (TPR) repeat protein